MKTGYQTYGNWRLNLWELFTILTAHHNNGDPSRGRHCLSCVNISNPSISKRQPFDIDIYHNLARTVNLHSQNLG